MKRIKLQIFGIVQGVSFHLSTKKIADSLEIKGWIKNMADGSVFVEAEGKEKDLKKFIEWCRQGPAFARVADFKIEYYQNLKNFKDFKIKY